MTTNNSSVLAYKVRFKRDTQANWETNNPVLKEGEAGFCTTNNGFKIGDGVTHWNNLPYMEQTDPISLGPCKGMSILFSANGRSICWTDPDDVAMNGATLAAWKRTSLVRKIGSYPESETDGTIVAQTAAADNTKDAYKTTAFVDTAAAPQDATYHYKLFTVSEWDVQNNLPQNELPVTDSMTPEMIHGFSQAGTLLNYMNVGDVIVVNHPEFSPSDGYTGQLVRFMGYDCVDVADGYGNTHAAVFQFEDCLYSSFNNYSTMSFDPAEPQYANTDDAKAVTGKTYYLYIDSAYVAMLEGTHWNAGDVSATYDGNTYAIADWFEKNPNPNYNYGCNKWVESNIRQYLNSDKPANEWWSKQNTWDVGAYKARNGFLYRLPFKSVLVPVRKKVAIATPYGGGSVTCVDRVFLPSLYEVFGTAVNSVNEGKKRWDWYATHTDASYRIKLLNKNASTWRLSSPYASYGNSTYTVTAAGASPINYSYIAYGIAPAFAL